MNCFTNCQHCSTPLKPAATRKKVGGKRYCDNACQQAFQQAQRKAAFENNEYVGYHMGFGTGSWPRRLLIEKFGYRCNCCGISEWNGKPLTLEVNHKDGDASNNTFDNVEFLCLNCHSQTSTDRALNRNFSRTHRNKKDPQS